MKTPNDGGPAFPVVKTTETDSEIWQNTSFANVHSVGGMTLRDWFAGMALQGIASGAAGNDGQYLAWLSAEGHNAPASLAWKLADDMLAERNKDQ